MYDSFSNEYSFKESITVPDVYKKGSILAPFNIFSVSSPEQSPFKVFSAAEGDEEEGLDMPA